MGGCFSKAPEKEAPSPAAKPKDTTAQKSSSIQRDSDKPSPADSSETATTLSDDPVRAENQQGEPVQPISSVSAESEVHPTIVQDSVTPQKDHPDSLNISAAETERPSDSPSRSKRGLNSGIRKKMLPPIIDSTATPVEPVAGLEGVSFPVQSEWVEGPYRPPRAGDPAGERARISALKKLGLDYTSDEPSLDFITKLITNVCNCRSAYLCFIDGSRCYVKSCAGVPWKARSLDRRLAISSHVLVPLKPEVLVVEDLSLDARFKEHPNVKGHPYARFFAGAPLLGASGHRIGCLAIHDFQPRKFDAESCNVLCNFAEMTMREIQRLSESSTLQRAMSLNASPENEQLLRVMDACSDGVVLLDVRIPRWPVLFSNEGWSNVTGLAPVSGSLKNFWDVFQLPGVSSSRHPWMVYDSAVERGEIFTLDVILAGSSGKQLFNVTFKPATESLDDGMVSINVPSRVASSTMGPSDMQYYFGTIFRRKGDNLSRSTSSSLGGAQASPSAPAQDDDMKPPIPNVRLGPLLGKGSFGSVHYGTWNGAQIAVKVIQHMATEAERQARDEQLEAILGLKMLHPNIVRTFQFATKDRSGSRSVTMTERMRMDMQSLPEEERGTPRGQRKMMETWIILELCNRGSLQEAIDKGAFRIRAGEPNEGAPNMINILRTATEIAGAMTYLHSLDILHSDLNGNNILLISNTGIDDRPFSVKVSDFGLSRIHIGERTVATQTYGTVTHMPPELLAEGRLSKAADVYAFGVLLWEMLTGQRPWAGLRHVQIITRKMHAGTQLKWPNHVYFPYKELAQRCMHPDSHERPTFSEALEKLEPMRELAERGELDTSSNGPEENANGDAAMLGNISKIEEGEEDKIPSK